jgi:hypothetical protein
LKKSVGDKYHIVPQVELTRLVNIHLGVRIPHFEDSIEFPKHTIDFVLFDQQFKPHLAIEMGDEPSSYFPNAHAVRNVVREAGLPLLYVKGAKNYSSVEAALLVSGSKS